MFFGVYSKRYVFFVLYYSVLVEIFWNNCSGYEGVNFVLRVNFEFSVEWHKKPRNLSVSYATPSANTDFVF